MFAQSLSEDSFIKLGGEAKIHLKRSGKRPFRAMTARRPPRALLEASQKLLRQLEKSGIIRRVHEPTEWVSPGMFIPKQGNSGEVRLVTNFSKLNKEIVRPVHGFPSAKKIRDSIKAESRFFCILDLTHGYFQVQSGFF